MPYTKSIPCCEAITTRMTCCRLWAFAGVLMLIVPGASGANADEGFQSSSMSNSSVARGGPLEVPRHVIANGGGRSSGNIWVVRGTIGQADADPGQPSTDGKDFYAITGGFWPGVPATRPRSDDLFDDRFEGLPD